MVFVHRDQRWRRKLTGRVLLSDKRTCHHGVWIKNKPHQRFCGRVKEDELRRRGTSGVTVSVRTGKFTVYIYLADKVRSNAEYFRQD